MTEEDGRRRLGWQIASKSARSPRFCATSFADCPATPQKVGKRMNEHLESLLKGRDIKARIVSI